MLLKSFVFRILLNKIELRQLLHSESLLLSLSSASFTSILHAL